MADPFSIVAGTVGLMDVLWRVGASIKRVHDATGTINEGIAELSHEIEVLSSVILSIQQTFKANNIESLSSSEKNADRIQDLWRLIPTILNDCNSTVSQLEDLINDMIGPENGTKPSGKMDAFKKTLRKDKRIPEFREKRQRVANCQISLQMLLSALNLNQDSTDLSIDNLSDSVQKLACGLHSDIASLRTRLAAADNNHFLEAINSASAVAKLVSINRFFYIPQTVSSIFTGRSSLLEELQKAFDVFQVSNEKTNVQKRFVVYGSGGSGKTQFCCKFAQENQDNFWGVFYIDASTPQTAESSFSSIVKIAGIEPSEGSNQRAAKDWLAAQKDPWLLIIDNADDPAHPLKSYFPNGKRGCILVTTRVLANKVHGTVGLRSYHFEQLPADEATQLLLKAAGDPGPWDIDTRLLADPISHALGFLPLALIQAGTTILTGRCALSDYDEYLRRSWERLRKARFNRHQQVDDENLLIYSSYEINLTSLEQSKLQSHIDAVQLLKMFSCFHRENIRVDVLVKAATNPRIEREQERKDAEEEMRFKAISKPKTLVEQMKDSMFNLLEFILQDRSPSVLPSVLRDTKQLSFGAKDVETRLRRALGHLTNMSLILRHDIGPVDSYSMHPLWHRWVRERPEMRLAEQALWCQAAKSALAQSILLPPHASSGHDEAMRRSLLPHMIHVRKCQEDVASKMRENKEISKSELIRKVAGIDLAPKPTLRQREALELAKFSRVYMECTLWKEAEDLQLRVKEYVCEKLGPDHPRAMPISLFLAATYMAQTRANEAATLQDHVLQVYMKSLGPDHPKIHKMMITLGATQVLQGKLLAALEVHQEAVKRMEVSFQDQSENVIAYFDEAIEDLEVVSQAKLDQAVRLHGETIRKMKRISGTEPEDLFFAWGNLGRVMWRYFRYGEAKRYYKKSALGLLVLLGPTHSRTQDALQDIAMSYLDFEGEPLDGKSEHLDAALAILQKLLEQRRKMLGEESPYTLLALGNMARIECARGNLEEAERSFRHILPIAARTMGEDHFGTIAGRLHFAQVFVRQGRYDEAEKILTKIIHKSRYKFAAQEGGDHPERFAALWYLMRCYERHGKVDDALFQAKELLNALEAIGGGRGLNHPFATRVLEIMTKLEAQRTKH